MDASKASIVIFLVAALQISTIYSACQPPAPDPAPCKKTGCPKKPARCGGGIMYPGLGMGMPIGTGYGMGYGYGMGMPVGMGYGMGYGRYGGLPFGVGMPGIGGTDGRKGVMPNA